MKHILLVLMTLLLMTSCSSDDNNDTTNQLVGDWKLSAIYADPGDGSGDFVAVSSEKKIKFNTNGTLSSNSNLCHLFAETGEPSSGTYLESEGSFSITDCNIMPVTGYYEIVDSNLIISYFCIESCQEKYLKID